MLGSWSKQPPGLGLTNGRLAACPISPNCVSSQADPADAVHYVPPFRFDGNHAEAWRKLIAIVRSQSRVRIIHESDTYLHAECTTALMRFVDDLELLLSPTEQYIDVRCASRIGWSDLGANRKRVVSIRRQFEAQ